MSLIMSSAHAEEWLSVSVPAQYDTMTVPDRIRTDCIGLDRTVGVEVAYKLEKSSFAKIERTDLINLKAPGKVLTLKITDASASNGEFTNARSLTVRVELFQNGKSFEWTTVSHSSRQQQDMCEGLEKNVAAIAAEIYKWLTDTLHSKTLPTSLDDAGAQAANIHSLQSRNLWISNKVQYDLGTSGQQLILQCNVEESLTEQARAVFSKSLSVKQLNKSGEEKNDDDVLQFTVVDIKGNIDNSPERRSMMLKAELLRNGVTIDSFNSLHATERGGLFGQVVRNTCDALNNIASIMVNDTYQWYLKRSNAGL